MHHFNEILLKLKLSTKDKCSINIISYATMTTIKRLYNTF